MRNSASFQRLSDINDALLKLTFADHQDVISFKVVKNGRPVIEITPGFTEHEESKNGYNAMSMYGCLIIWPNGL